MKGVSAQRGALSLEMIIVVGLLILLFSWAISRTDMMRSRAGTLVGTSNMVTLGENVRSLLKDSTGYGASGTDLVPSLIQNNGVPKNITVNGNTLVNDYGGLVTIVSTGPGFVVSNNALPPEICSQDARHVSKSATYSSMAINGNAAITGEVSASAATAQCNLSGSANNMVFTSTF